MEADPAPAQAESGGDAPMADAPAVQGEAAAQLEVEDPLSLPPHGAEVFMGGIPRGASEEEIREFASEAGEVHSVKLVRDPSNPAQNRGYGFVRYTAKEGAITAMDRLNSKEVPGHAGSKVRVQPSQAKNRLFVGGLPTDLTSEALRAAVELVAVGLQKADVMRNREHPEQGRGFAFLEYYNAACAALAKAALSSPGFRIGDKPLSVDFAEPSAREAAAAGGGVKVVFVGNLTEEATEEGLNAAMAKYGAIERVHIPRPREGGAHSRFGFVTFAERVSAMRAVEDADPPELNGTQLALKYGRSDSQQQTQRGGGGGGYARGGGGGGYGGGGRGGYGMGGGRAMAGGMAMGGGMPMLMGGGNLVPVVPVQLANGQVGYVLQTGAMGMDQFGGGGGGDMRRGGRGGGGGGWQGDQYGGGGGGRGGRGGRGYGGGGGGGGQRYQPY